MHVAIFESPLGKLLAHANEAALVKLHFLNENENTSEITQSSNEILVRTRFELEQYFLGKLKEFTIPLAPEGSDFQKRVWNSLLSVPFGVTRSYHQQSVILGDPLAIRAVASANGKNPIAIIIPCHRIIGSDGSLTGYAGGLWRKRKLLELEGVVAEQFQMF